MRSGDGMIVPGDLEGSCNIVSYIWSFEGKAYISICNHLGRITESVKVKLMLRLIVPWDLGMKL